MDPAGGGGGTKMRCLRRSPILLDIIIICALAPAAPSLLARKMLPSYGYSAAAAASVSGAGAEPLPCAGLGILSAAPPQACAGLMKLRGGKGDGGSGSAQIHVDQGRDQALAGALETDEDREMLFKSAWDMDFFETGVDPLFMQGLTEEEADMARDEYVDALMNGEDNETQLAEHWKLEGNKYAAKGLEVKAIPNEDRGNYTKLYAHAIRCYSTAIKNSRTNPLVRIQAHSNRASAHLERGNYGHAFSDSIAAVNLSAHAASGRHAESNPLCSCKHGLPEACGAGGNFTGLGGIVKKSLGRAARACLHLKRWREAVSLCDEALLRSDVEWGDASLLATKRQAQRGLDAEEVIAQRAAEAEQRRKKKMFTLKDAVRDRGVMVGASMYHEILMTQRVDIDFLDWGGGGLGRFGSVVCWPTLMIYEEERQSDFIKQCAEDSTIEQHLETVLGEETPPAVWDPSRRYTPGSVNVYIATYQAPLLVGGKKVWIEDEDTGRRCPMEWRRVDERHTVSEVLCMEGHVVPRMLVLHIVVAGSPFEAHMLADDPEKYTN